MQQLWGFSPLVVMEDVAFLPPHENLSGFISTLYEVPNLGNYHSIFPVEHLIDVALKYNLRARIIDNLYIQQDWCNSWYDYNEISLEHFPDLPVTPSKRRNEYRKIQRNAQDNRLNLKLLDKQITIDNLPKFVYDDAATLFIAQYLRGNEEIESWGYYNNEDVLVGISLLKFDQASKVCFNWGLIRLTEGISAKDMTYWLCQLAKDNGMERLDIHNLAFSQREEYKKAFFTGTIRAYCWTNNCDDLIWMHKIEDEI